jgi:NADPH-dependent 2,4-dienoyl-CoA reductase/sulfur reductase-like enzyme
MHFLIIGGSDAGISAALRAREFAPEWEVTVLLSDEFPNYSICGLPFFVSGETPEWRSLAHRTEFPGVQVLTTHTAEAIDPERKTVHAVRSDGSRVDIRYDRLLIGSGARPVQPQITGLDLPGVFQLHTMANSFSVRKFLEERRPESVVIIGAGYIGLEMADAFTHRGIHVTIASRTCSVLPTVDREFGERVEVELNRHNVEVFNQVEVTSISAQQERLLVSGTREFTAQAELVLVAVGVQPNSELGSAAGIPTGIKGALQVTRRMETGLEHVYAAGDCVETWHRILNRPAYLPLGTTAHKQGRVAAENAIGGNREFAGSIGTQVVKIFDLVAARTGLRDREARQGGFDPFTSQSKSWDHKAYYPGAQELSIRLTGDRGSTRLLGAQMLGHIRSEVSKRVDVYASALFHGMDIEELNDLDLSYTPPLSSPWDPVQMAVQEWQRALRLEGAIQPTPR